ncbi:MAG TPA: tRNA (adenosine(37)-N6)-dimethylallyltransferase MiaA [Candidatus Paceibacterota bacterium]|nr:tRNA (adenosine(37)-N6)-dimethylallyltransferase MiaA [Candidatus Paceibacterota bacterium]
MTQDTINDSLPKLIAVVGPTASGKTALGIALAQALGGEIISADSRQVYRGMDIGTAKPTAAERRAVPHHLIDIRYPDEDYTVADYQRDAIAAIRDVIARGRVPLLVGGTGLYVRAVVENLDIPAVVADPRLRAEIEREIADEGLAAVFKKLVALDPEAEYIVDPKNPRRVVRALEVARATGEPFTAQRRKHHPLFETLTLGIDPSPDVLRDRIDRRVDAMMRDGLVEETRALVKKYGGAQAAFDAIGYREIVAHLNGTLSLAGAMTDIKLNTWHYAKRQMTWFRKGDSVQWIADTDEAIVSTKRFLQ